MGLTVHYRGRIRDYALVEELIEEVEVFAKEKKWKCMIFRPGENSPLQYADRKNPEPLPEVKGIVISPENCEPICLTFLNDGRLCAPFYPPIEIDGFPHVFTKTQYAGIEVHLDFLKLLKALNRKYFSELKVDDEGEYWETEDEEHLSKRFGHDNFLMDHLEEALKTIGCTVENGEPNDFNDTIVYFDGSDKSA